MTFQTARIVEAYGRELQDRAQVIEREGALVLVVADGAGGRSGGAEAADGAVAGIRAAAKSMQDLRNGESWRRLLGQIDAEILEDAAAGETTAVVVAVTARGIAGASVGDSGAWLISPSSYVDLTADAHPKPFLGTGCAIPVAFSAGPLRGTLLLASDGLLKYAGPESICEAAREPDIELAARHLIDLVRLRSGRLPDDVAVLLCRPAPAPGDIA